MNVVIVGGGISGLTLALGLHRNGTPCRVYEAAPEFKPLGVGITLQAHGTRRLVELGLLEDLRRVAVPLEATAFYNRFGQLVHRAPASSDPQFLIHRADLHAVLLEAVYERLGEDAVVLDRRCVGVEQDESGAVARFVDSAGATTDDARGDVVVACDGIHSAVRRQFYPLEGEPVWSGVNLWRGVTVREPFLDGHTHVRVGELESGKMVIYPIRDDVDGRGSQLINWVAEFRSGEAAPLGWNIPADPAEVAARFVGWSYDWLDVAALVRDAESIFQFPMSDRDPVERWAFDRVLLIGDAAHPMLPRGGNGGMQAIVDAAILAEHLAGDGDPRAALKQFEDARLEGVNAIVRASRTTPPDTLLELVRERVGDRPFARREDAISDEEIARVLAGYRQVTLSSEGRA